MIQQRGGFFLAPIPGPVGKLIEFGMYLNGEGFDRIQHAGIYLGDSRTIEAYPKGAIEGDIHRFDPASLMWSTLVLTEAQRDLIVRIALGYKGTPYSFADYFAIEAHRLHLPLPLLKAYVASSKHLICSQLVDQVYKDAGIHLFPDGRWPGYVTPASLIPGTDKGHR